MGKLEHIYHEQLINPVPDRHPNICKIERSNNGELHIHYRNLKIALIDKGEQEEWVKAFREAKDKLLQEGLFKNDLTND